MRERRTEEMICTAGSALVKLPVASWFFSYMTVLVVAWKLLRSKAPADLMYLLS